VLLAVAKCNNELASGMTELQFQTNITPQHKKAEKDSVRHLARALIQKFPLLTGE